MRPKLQLGFSLRHTSANRLTVQNYTHLTLDSHMVDEAHRNMPLTTHPLRLLIAIFAPILLRIVYLAILDLRGNWLPIASAVILCALTVSASSKLIRGEAVSLPGYYITIKSESSFQAKVMGIVALVAPIYLIAFLSINS